MGALTSTTIIDQALGRLGNDSLTVEAGIWLLNALDRLYEDFQWPFLETTATGALTEGQSSVNLPADFDSPVSHNSFGVIDENGIHHALSFNTGFDQDQLVNPDLDGTPERAFVNLDAMTWRPYPLPNKAYTWQVRYKKKIARSDVAFTPDFPNDDILIQAVYVRGLQYEDDDRFAAENTELQRMVALYKRKFNLQAQKSQRVLLSRKFSTPTNFR
jgi:hypothetical protein